MPKKKKVRLTRKQAVRFANAQLEDNLGEQNNLGEQKMGYHHYGRCQIQQLLDQIYGVNSAGEKVELIEF